MTKSGNLNEFITDKQSKPVYDKTQTKNYLLRIGYLKNTCLDQSLPEPTLELLKSIMTCHLNTLPYGNLSMFYYQEKLKSSYQSINPTDSNNPTLTKGVSTHPIDIYTKLVVKKLDGYCFEQNLLMFYILESLGFARHLVIAKVVDLDMYKSSGEVAMTGMRHCAIIVKLDNIKYLVDVGYNPIAVFQPVPIFDEVTDDSLAEEIPLIDGTKLQVVRRYPPSSSNGSPFFNPLYLTRTKVPKTFINESSLTELVWVPLFFFDQTPVFPQDLERLNAFVVSDTVGLFNQHIVMRKRVTLPEFGDGVMRIFDSQLKFLPQNPELKVQRWILSTENERRKAYFEYYGIQYEDEDLENLPKSFINFGSGKSN